MTGNTSFDFSGNIAFIFGGAGGIGREIARSIGSRGGIIHLFDISRDGLLIAERELTKSGVSVHTHVTDITKYESVSQRVDEAISISGRVDILVSGASIITRKSVFELSYEEWLRTLAINLDGTFLACSIVGKIMLTQGYGRIMTFSSQNSSGAINNADYSASKAGVDSLTRSMAAEFRERGKDVTINAISPPPTITELWKKGRNEHQVKTAVEKGTVFGPDEMMDVIMFLCSRESCTISGQIISHRANLFRVPNR